MYFHSKDLLRKLPGYYRFKNSQNRHKQQAAYTKWQLDGMPSPPPHMVKQQLIRELASSSGIRILVETGTYYGDMFEATRNIFDKIYSIEVNERLYQIAKYRFRKDNRIEIIHGDSAEQIRSIIVKLREPAIFWLDGHYSGGVTGRGAKDTPVIEELDFILNSGFDENIILIDDARCFGTDNNYPSLDVIRNIVLDKYPDTSITVSNDSIRVIPSVYNNAG